MVKILAQGRRCVFFAAAVLACSVAGEAGQKNEPTLPTVSFAEVPLYPPLARVTKSAGIVHLLVTTDGHHVVSTRVIDGPKLLTAAAESNAKSWRFAAHGSTTFRVTYVYKLVSDISQSENNPRVLLSLPTKIELDSAFYPPIDAGQ
jgi:hypothetical protein